MSLPDNPNTLRETYYSVIAGQNDASILPDIETAPSTENRYLDYIAKHGGGGGGDVSGVKGDAETTYRTGNVNITAANVGAYTTAQTNTLLDGKTDTVEAATENNFAAFDDSGNLKDSEKSSNDFAPANIVPSNASTDNKLSTAADTAGEEIASTATGVSITLTDSADGYVQGVTVKGHSEKSKNLFNPDNVINAYISGEAIITSDPNSRIIYASCLPNTTYTVSKKAGQRFNVCTTESVPQAGMSVNQIITGIGTNTSATLTTNSSAKYIVAYVYNANSDTGTAAEMLGTCQIEEGSTATDYEPYFSGIKSIGDAGWGVVDLGTLEWDTSPEPVAGHTQFRATITAAIDVSIKPLCSNYPIDYVTTWENLTQDKSAGAYYESSLTRLYIRIVDTAYTDATAFKSAMSGVLLYYPLADTTGATPTFGITSKNGAGQGTGATITTGLPLRSTLDGTVYDELTNEKVITRCEVVNNEVVPLATPTETPLTSAEIAALAALQTYNNITHINATDAPTITVDYLKNTDNGQAVANIQTDLQGQINGLAIKTLTYTGTGTTTNSITFPDKPLMVLGYTQDSDYDTYVRGIMPFFFHPSTAMLRVFWKNKSEASHRSDYTYSSSYVLTINGNSISWTGLDASQALNSNGVEYTVYYI